MVGEPHIVITEDILVRNHAERSVGFDVVFKVFSVNKNLVGPKHGRGVDGLSLID